MAVVGDADGPGALDGERSNVAIDARGRFYVPSRRDAVIRVFDTNARYLQSVGARGQGPGEFAFSQYILFWPRDTMLVYDPDNARLTVFAPSYALVRSVRIPPIRFEELAHVGGETVFAGAAYTRDLVGFPLYLVDRRGTLVRAFGSDNEVVDGRSPYAQRRRLAAAAAATMWSAHLNSYVVDQWDTSGRWLLHIDRAAAWFPPWRIQPGPASSTPPLPAILGVQEDNEGRLWILISVKDAEWRPREPARYPGGAAYIPEAERALVYDTVIEVINPRTGRLIASQRFPDYYVRFASAGVVQSAATDASGNPQIALWRVRLIPTKEKP